MKRLLILYAHPAPHKSPVAGVIIGPHALSLVGGGKEGAGLMHVAEFVVVMMLFPIGLELKLPVLWRMRGSLLGLGGLQVLGSGQRGGGVRPLAGAARLRLHRPLGLAGNVHRRRVAAGGRHRHAHDHGGAFSGVGSLHRWRGACRQSLSPRTRRRPGAFQGEPPALRCCMPREPRRRG
jgi:Sodium/hydrogen exchanger family